VPSFLRTKLPRAKIGLFIHTPFPSSDILRLLPAREPLLRGMMCADLLGFHTFDYGRHFLSCCKRYIIITPPHTISLMAMVSLT
jgi:trehalose 6-phosphate synthase/phosphatase